jgi:hypothetical protein
MWAKGAEVRRIALVATIALLAGCDQAAPPKVATALPKKVCEDAQAAVTQATKSGAVVVNSPVEVMIAQESWLPMPEAQRDGLTRALGIAATCAGGVPKLEQEVVVRSDTGMVLTRRIIQTSFSPLGE